MVTPDTPKPGPNASARQRIALDELSGKNSAAQAYDERLWKIRTGFLTLTFAAWGALLTLAADEPQLLAAVAVPMCFVTAGLAIAGAWNPPKYRHYVVFPMTPDSNGVQGVAEHFPSLLVAHNDLIETRLHSALTIYVCPQRGPTDDRGTLFVVIEGMQCRL